MPNEFSSYEQRPQRASIGPLSAVLIGICVVVAILTQLGEKESVLQYLYITFDPEKSGGQPLPEVLHGEVWRLLSPTFLHFGIMHIVFNMLWLKDLGTAIEKLSGTWTMLALTVIIGIAANLAEFHFTHSPFFGGMSGVVYGLLGYIWMKSKFDPGSGYFLPNQTVLMMIVWFCLCVAGVIPHVANWAHGAGLIIGIVWGLVSAKTARS